MNRENDMNRAENEIPELQGSAHMISRILFGFATIGATFITCLGLYRDEYDLALVGVALLILRQLEQLRIEGREQGARTLVDRATGNEGARK